MGTTKDISIDDLPELPSNMQKKLTYYVKEIVKKTRGKRLLFEEEVDLIRELFFNFFCNLLKHYYVGQDDSDWKKLNKS